MIRSNDTERRHALANVIEQLEAALRRMELWQTESPGAAKLASRQPFSVDTLAFPEWLQWQLLPRLRQILAGAGELPTSSAIHPYAEECLRQLACDPAELLFLIGHLDELIRGDRPTSSH